MKEWIEKNILAVVVIVLLLVYCSGLLVGRRGCNSSTPGETVRETTTVVRTVKVPVPVDRIVLKTIPAKIETVLVDSSKTLEEIARAEQIVETRDVERVYLDTVRVAYYFRSRAFDVEVALQERQAVLRDTTITIREVETVTVQEIDWKIVGAAVAVGVAVGISISK